VGRECPEHGRVGQGLQVCDIHAAGFVLELGE